MDKFKTLALALVVLFGIVLILGFVVLEATARPTASYLIFASSVLTPLLTFAALGYQQQKTAEQVKAIGKSVNGNTTRLIDAATGGEPLSDSERAQILGDAARLPSHLDADEAPRHARG